MADLNGSQADDVAHRYDHPILRIETLKGGHEIDLRGVLGGVAPRAVPMLVVLSILDVDLDDGATVPPSDQLSRLVRSDGDKPRPKPGRVPQRAELAPRDRPCGLDRVVSHVQVAADDEADTRHIAVVGRDNPSERDLVAGGRQFNDTRENFLLDETAHTL